MRNDILVLGAGAWGTAIANLLAENCNKKILLWAFEKKVSDSINNKQINTLFLPKIKLNKNVLAINNFYGIRPVYIFIVVPSQFVYSIVKKYTDSISNEHRKKISVIICSKGLDLKRRLLLSDVLKTIFPLKKIAILSGPSFANLVAEGQPTAVTVSSKNLKLAEKVRSLLINKKFRVYINDDIIGVQIYGAIKNILAIAAGITEGLGYGENARAAIICRGINEIEKVSLAFGGKKQTSLSLSGIGDIFLTCSSVSSRNYTFGFLIGKGKSKSEILKKNSTVTEGFENVKALYLIKKKHNLDTPILDSIYKILVKGYSVKKIVNFLLARPLKKE